MLAEQRTTPAIDTTHHATGPDPIWVTFKERRTAAGHSLDAVAARTGIPASVIGSYERGQRRPSLNKARLVLATEGLTLTVVPPGHHVLPSHPSGDASSWVEWLVDLGGARVADLTEASAHELAARFRGASVVRVVHTIAEQVIA